jgi:spore coat polysaccharide biosynthesis protein SpsF (cytidylyltransferase family)
MKNIKVINFSAARGYHGVNLAVDTKMDFEKFRFIVQHMQKPAWTYNLDEVVAIANIPERPADGCAA